MMPAGHEMLTVYWKMNKETENVVGTPAVGPELVGRTLTRTAFNTVNYVPGTQQHFKYRHVSEQQHQHQQQMTPNHREV